MLLELTSLSHMKSKSAAGYWLKLAWWTGYISKLEKYFCYPATYLFRLNYNPKPHIALQSVLNMKNQLIM